MPRIDSHQHFWRLARGDYRWLSPPAPALAPIHRDFAPSDLGPLLRHAEVEATVLVQAADTLAETDELLRIAQTHEFVGAVVGWVDLGRDDAAAVLRRWSEHPKFKGVRPMLQDLPDTGWIAHAPNPDALRALLDLGLRFDALVKPPHLDGLLRFVRAWPELPVVIDHASKPVLSEGWDAPWAERWRRGLSELAGCPQVYCKFSGLLTEAGDPARGSLEARVDALHPVWEFLLDRFGPARLMWGSDWPVMTLAGDYASWVETCRALFAPLSAADQQRVWADSARAFYGIGSRTP